ncbi:hypothetical protein ACQY0O_007795 [Thecaphora frezii]
MENAASSSSRTLVDAGPSSFSTKPRQLSAAEFQARTAVAAAASAQMSGSTSQRAGGRKRSANLVATGAVVPSTLQRDSDASAGGLEHVGPSTLQHPVGNVTRTPLLGQIPEGLYEPDSPRYKRSRLQHASMQVEPTKQDADQGRTRARTMSPGSLLARGYDASTATVRPREERPGRPRLASIFSDERSPNVPQSLLGTPSSQFPNPHTPVLERDYEMTTAQLQRRMSGAKMPPQMALTPEMDVQPASPLLPAPGHFHSPNSPQQGHSSRRIHPADRPEEAYVPPTASYQQERSDLHREPEWESDDSSETPTASSVAAGLAPADNVQPVLTPVALFHPYNISKHTSGPAPVGEVGSTAAKRDLDVIGNRVSAVDYANPNETAAQTSPKDSNNATAQERKQVPRIRTDLQNLRRISAAVVKRGGAPYSAAAPSSQSQAPRHVSTNQGSGYGQDRGAKLLSVGGHVLGTSKATLLLRKDGTARPIYSPTPLTVAAARGQQQAQKAEATQTPGTLDTIGVTQALPASATTPPAPQLPYQIRFRHSQPNLSSSSSESSRHQSAARSPPEATAGDKLPDQRRASIGAANIAAEPPADLAIDPSLLKEANRKLFLYQKQQQAEEERRLSSNQNPVTEPDVIICVESATDDGATEGPFSPHNLSARSEEARRSSVDTAATAFDADEASRKMHRTLSGRRSKKLRSIPANVEGQRHSTVPDLSAGPTAAPAAGRLSENGSTDSQHTESYIGTRETQLIIDTRMDDSGELNRFIPILNTGTGDGNARPRTGNTRVSFYSGRSREGRPHTMPACRRCFRTGFDCAMNLHLGEGTAGRKAFQDFVAAGGLDALSIDSGARQSHGISNHDASVTVGGALGKNYVDKLGEVAFGESALSRPVTRGMIDNLLEEKQERDSRDRLVLDHKPWSADEEDEAAATKEAEEAKPQTQRQRQLSQSTLRDEPFADTIDAETGAPIFQKADMEVADFDSLSDRTFLDDLNFLADRWPLWRKVIQMLVLAVYLFALQALDSGFTQSIPLLIAEFRPSPMWSYLVGLGMLCFNGSQISGLLIGCSLSGMGRQRLLLVTLVLVGAVSVIAGFSKAVIVTLVLQTLLGLLSGTVLYLTAAMLVDMFDTYTTRLVGLMLLVFGVAMGQFAGPWIAKLFLAQATWSWQYWSMLAFAAVMFVVVGFTAKETNPAVLFRRRALVLRAEQGLLTPEPYPEITLGQVVREDGIRPFRVFVSSWNLPLLTLTTAFFLGIFVFMYAGIHRLFVEVHGLTPTMGALASTVAGVLGVFWAIFALLIIDSRVNGTPQVRALHIDEKGYIESTKPERKVERVLIGAIFGAGLFSLSLYTLALTSHEDAAWIFSAFAIVMHTAGLVIFSISALEYALDSFSPARRIEVHDVTTRIEDEALAAAVPSGHVRPDPYTAMPKGLSRRNSHESIQTAAEQSKHWSNQAALAAISIMAGISIIISNVLYLPSMQPSPTLSFQTLTIIFASLSLFVIGVPILLYIYGNSARKAAIAKLDSKQRLRAFRRRSKRGGKMNQLAALRPVVLSARASRVAPWISACLSGNVAVGQGEAAIAGVQLPTLPLPVLVQGQLAKPEYGTEPLSADVKNKRDRKSARAPTRYTGERDQSSSRRTRRQGADGVASPAAERMSFDAGGRPLTPIVQRHSHNLSSFNLPLDVSAEPAVEAKRHSAKADGRYWTRGRARHSTMHLDRT